MVANIDIHRADSEETLILLGMWKRKAIELLEAGIPMWNMAQFSIEALKEKYVSPQYFICYTDNRPSGGFILIEEDRRYWPGSLDRAFYLHKFVVDSEFRGQNLSGKILDWVKAYGTSQGKAFIRLDFEEDRGYLRDMYFGSGFKKVDVVKVSGKDITTAEYRI